VFVCLSVCVYVTFVNSVKTNKHMFKIFSPSGIQAIIHCVPKNMWPHFRWQVEVELSVYKKNLRLFLQWIATLCLKKNTGLPRLIWQLHRFTTFTNYFGTDEPHSVLNWLRTSCMVAITTVAIGHTRTANFSADFEQRVMDRTINK